MALLDDLVGSVVSAVAGDKAPALQQFLQANCGVTGLAAKFQSGDAAQVFQTWVSTNDNQAITPAQIEAVLGSSQVKDFAAKMGVDPNQAASFIAQHLPSVIDKLTPNGQLPTES
jgi:uncharacterized protein YidB (DUF937 family)